MSDDRPIDVQILEAAKLYANKEIKSNSRMRGQQVRAHVMAGVISGASLAARFLAANDGKITPSMVEEAAGFAAKKIGLGVGKLPGH